MNYLGQHVLLELRECNRSRLDDIAFVRDALLGAARGTGATVIDHIFHKFSPQGVTGVIAIAESHLCIHTWPEYGYAAIDIFTCGEEFSPNAAIHLLVEVFESGDHETKEIARGALPQLSPEPSPTGG